jgi:hypothetical protein
MPRVKPKSPFRPSDVVVCVESFVTSATGSPFPVPAGTRLPADHPIVKATTPFWAPDGTPADEIARQRAAIYREHEAPPPEEIVRTRPELRIKDEDALVSIANGERVHKNSEAARSRPEAYVPVVPPGLDRRDALVATQTMSLLGEGGDPTRVLYAGQWASRDDEFVRLHPHSFALPPPA